uniref:Uncharacterized protein n=1 Tax=Anguilla anguilla TaxID=7936 RepID=A0A0E9T3P9_ANGAN
MCTANFTEIRQLLFQICLLWTSKQTERCHFLSFFCGGKKMF